MKRLLVTMTVGLILTLIFQQVNAQTEKGNWLLGGSGTFQYNYYKPSGHTFLIQFYPKGGFFVAHNLVIGLMPSFDITLSGKNSSNIVVYNYYSLSIGPFARYYYPLSSNISLFAEGYFTYGRSFYKPKIYTGDYNLYNWRVGPGVAFFLSPSVSLDASAGYRQNITTIKNAGIKNTSKARMVDVQLGFSIYLSHKKK